MRPAHWIRSPGCKSGAFFLLLLTGVASAEPTTRPARSPDVIAEDMSLASRQLKVAVGNPRDMADPAKRAVIAPNAIPPLRRLIADDRDLAAAVGRPTPTFLEIQLRAIGAALADPESTDALSRLAADPSQSLRGQGGQLLARWLRSPGDAAAQSKIVDELAALDGAHPDSDDLAHFTGLMTGSAATPAVRARLRGLLGPMTSPRAALLRQPAPSTQP